jgi:hypothetical protein
VDIDDERLAVAHLLRHGQEMAAATGGGDGAGHDALLGRGARPRAQIASRPQGSGSVPLTGAARWCSKIGFIEGSQRRACTGIMMTPKSTDGYGAAR